MPGIWLLSSPVLCYQEEPSFYPPQDCLVFDSGAKAKPNAPGPHDSLSIALRVALWRSILCDQERQSWGAFPLWVRYTLGPPSSWSLPMDHVYLSQFHRMLIAQWLTSAHSFNSLADSRVAWAWLHDVRTHVYGTSPTKINCCRV